MQGEFLIDRILVRFEIDMGGLTETPKTMAVTTRKCPTSPTLVYDLAWERDDADRNVAIYRVLGSRSPAVMGPP